MRNVIKYFYNLYATDVKEYDSYTIFSSEGKIYILKKVANPENMINIYNNINSNKQNTHLIIRNNQNEYITKIDSNEYVLLELLNVQDIIDNNFSFVSYGVINNQNDIIPELWSKKVDYYMSEIRNIGVDKTLLIDAFNYYVGLAENAIAIYNRALDEELNVRYVISHKRIKYPNYGINYYDPTSLIVDTISRDLSEYIKAKFFCEKVSENEVLDMIEKYNLNSKEIKILFSRLLYPSYFFDELERIIGGNYSEEKINIIMNYRKEYENMLKNLYFYVKKNNHFPEIEWLNK